jgi:hypothetical protein
MVTEYMEMGSLYYLIHMSGQKKKLSWRRKLKIIRDICRYELFSLQNNYYFIFLLSFLTIFFLCSNIVLKPTCLGLSLEYFTYEALKKVGLP